jgi:PEP-CTERM motif
VSTERFEGFAPGTLSPLTLTFGPDTASLTGAGEVRNLPTGTFFGTHPISGDQFLLANAGGPAAFTVAFSSPQAAFGFYATDIGDQGGQLDLLLTHANGATTTLRVPHTVGAGAVTSGSIFYFGVLDVDSPFVRVTFLNGRPGNDGFGFDDMTIGRAANVLPVPEPGAYWLAGVAAVAVGWVVRWRRGSAHPTG